MYVVAFAAEYWKYWHCVKSVHILRFSGPFFPEFELDTEIYRVANIARHEAGVFSAKCKNLLYFSSILNAPDQSFL